ncbi:MAG: hypothetical protein ACFCUP_14730 [Actinomycetales bacterium]
MTGWEEEYLARHQSDANTSRTCNELLALCCAPPGAEPGGAREAVRGLLVAERDRELVRLRRMSLGPDVTAQADCPECGSGSEIRFSLDEPGPGEALLAPRDEAPSAREFDVQLAGVGRVRMRLPTAGDQADMVEELMPADGPDAGSESALEASVRRTWLLARCVTAFGPGAGPLDVTAARAMPVAQRGALVAALEERLPDSDLSLLATCPECRHGFTVALDMSIFFFRDERPRRGSVARRPPDRPGLSLGRGGDPRPAAGTSRRLPDAVGGGRRRRTARRSAGRAAVRSVTV